ncbi:MAG: hypothetical protein EPN45_06240 [Rhizobiaceae bacterium]|nr:MAG: hypothetical protein EPN45_06240 [Rhizobiaceae bacterium]
MAVPPEVRIPLENEKMMMIYQPALGESLDAIMDGEALLFHGFAEVNGSESYYLVTHRGVYYCTKEKLGLFKSHYVPQFTDLGPAEDVQVEIRDDRGWAFLRFVDENGKMVLRMWFKDELSGPFRKMSAEDEAMRFATKFST